MTAENSTNGALHQYSDGFAEGEDYVRLHFNESPYGPPPGAVDVAVAELTAHCALYPDPECRLIRERIARHFGVSPDMVAVANGTDELILLSSLTFLTAQGQEPGTVALTDRTFPGYASSAAVAGASVRVVPMTDGQIPAGGLGAALREGADLAFICNPHNPTGAVLDRDGVAEIIDAAQESGAVAVFDEAYMDFAGPEHEFAVNAVRAGHRLIVLRTFSKAWGLAALRIGYAIGPAELISRIWRTRSCLPFDVNRLAQYAAAAALDRPEHVERVRRATAEARERMCQALDAMGVGFASSVSNFVMVKLNGDSTAISRELADRHHFLVRDLRPFGLPGCLRVTVGTADQADSFCAALADVLAQPGERRVTVTSAGPAAVRTPFRPLPVTPAMSPAALFNGYIGVNVFYALHELGVLPRLAEGTATMADLAPHAEPGRFAALMRTMSQLGYIALRDGAVTLTSQGQDLVRQQGYFTWCVGGHSSVWANLAELADGRARYGHDLCRNDARVAMGSGEADALLMRPIQERMCATIEFGSVADIGCGDGTRLIRMCGGDRRRRGVGIDISEAACRLAIDHVTQTGLAERVDIVQADILDILAKRTFPGIELVMSIFMLHDLFSAAPDHAEMVRSLRATFPDARYFLLADTTTRPAGEQHDAPPIFSLGFELAHAFMGVSLQTRETYEAAFEAAGLRLRNCVPFGAPSTWLFLLEAT